jgi:mannose-1-phosphate guanylyltransferase
MPHLTRPLPRGGQVRRSNLWAIVLAGGESTRVRGFLKQLCGGNGLKQFSSIIGRRSMLQHTLSRMQQRVSLERILVVVSAQHREEASRQLAHLPQENIIYQPANRDTAPGILLPLSYITHRDPSATVIVSPSDHFVRDENHFMDAVGNALRDLKQHPDKMVLLGMTPAQGQESEYGYIQTQKHSRAGRTRPVAGFIEKPPLQLARRLIHEGALWNTMVFTVKSTTLWQMVEDSVPSLISSVQAPSLIEQIYQTIPNVNFSSDICEPMTAKLRVLAVSNVGWSDWGTVASILRSMVEIGKLDAFRLRLEQSQVHPSWYAASLAEIDPEWRAVTPNVLAPSLRSEIDAFLLPD